MSHWHPFRTRIHLSLVNLILMVVLYFCKIKRVGSWRLFLLSFSLSYWNFNTILFFSAPELLDFAPVSGAADMWSIGILVYAL